MFTDGACSGNPGPGGWGVVVIDENKIIKFSGRELSTTNNRMELQAAIEGIKKSSRNVEITLYTDSLYVKNGITSWISNWKKKNWKTANKKTVKNKELWIELDSIIQDHKITWEWVKGHSGHTENERADLLANKGIDSLYK